MRARAFPILVILMFPQAGLGAVGFQQLTVPDAAGKPLAIAIWYPSDAQPSPQPLGMFSQTVAVNGDISGNRLPLVLISHGTSGSLFSHYDTALALAEAGFVVVAVTHTGDNYRDQSYAGNHKNLIDRPRQLSLVLDYILSTWAGNGRLDAGRIGIFGFFKQRHGDQLDPLATTPAWVHDIRIKAAVVAAPAVSYLFGDGGLRQVRVPVQLWRTEKDQQAPDPWNSAIVRQELPTPPEEHVVPGEDHFIFLAPCSDALAKANPQICTDAPGFDRLALHRQWNQSIVAFFRSELKIR